MLKSFLVFHGGSPAGDAALEDACRLASRFGGKVYVAFVLMPALDPALASGLMAGSMEYVATLPLTAVEDLERERQAREQLARDVLARATEVCRCSGVNCRVLTLHGDPEEALAEQVGMVDLLVIGKLGLSREKGDAAGDAPAPLEHLTERLVRGATQPVLVTTAPSGEYAEVILLHQPGAHAVRATALAAELARTLGLVVRVATAGADEETVREQQAAAMQYLADHGVQAVAEAIAAPSDVDRALVEWLESRPRSLVMLAAQRRSWIRQLIGGRTTRAVLRSTAHPVIFTH